MIEAFGWAALAASALMVGAVAGITLNRIPRTWVGLALAFGAGALISAIAFELTIEAFRDGGLPILAAGLSAGAFTYFVGNWWLKHRGGARRGKTVRPAATGQGLSIVLGAVLDGIPESIVLGAMLLTGGVVSPAFFAAVLLSNVPEGFSASADLTREGHEAGWILRLWTMVVVASGLAAALAWAVLDVAGPAIPFAQAFAAGGLITMLVDTMIPEAYEDSGDRAGLVTVLGFALAFVLSAAS
ncbi:MAG: ZIP family metal transporter [Candidatus Limnocylindria bacterium]